MVEEVLGRQARARAEQTGESLEKALEAVLETEAGRQLKELESGPHRYERAQEWQDGVARTRIENWMRHVGLPVPAEDSNTSRLSEDRHYSWFEDYLAWLEGKEARGEYYALLERAFGDLTWTAIRPQ